MSKRHIARAMRRLSAMREVHVRYFMGGEKETVDISVPTLKRQYIDGKDVTGFYLRWLRDLRRDEAEALRDCLIEVL